MNRMLTSALVVATVALLATLFVSSGAPAAPSAPLADIRTTSLLDDFDRPDEFPIGSSNGAWAEANTGWAGPAGLVSQRFAPGPPLEAPDPVGSYWTAASFSGDIGSLPRFR